MMAKKPADRYQTAGDVAQRLIEWLADRGYKPDSGAQKIGSGSDGVGSVVFRRFAASLDLSGSASGSSAGSLSGHSSIIGMSDTRLSGSDTKPSTLQRHEGQGSTLTSQNDEDIGLAPLEEETVAKQDEPLEETVEETNLSDSWASEALPELPIMSLIEEQLEAGRLGNSEAEGKVMRRKPEDITPLYPPGYVRPRTGTSPWLYVGLGLMVCMLLSLLIWIATL